MDIKDLNKPQLILLAVLLSFVTSVATGITTVTLMQQAPTSITTPVNNVVRQTIEKIQQVEGKTITQTVVIKEEDLVVDAIGKNKSALFSLSREIRDIDSNLIEISAGVGFVISSPGVIVSDASMVFDTQGTYFVKNESGKFKANFLFTDKGGFSFLKIGEPLDGKSKVSFTVPTVGDINKMKIGQKILVFGNTITSFIFEGNKDLKTNISKGNAGSMVLDLNGEVLGIALSGDSNSFASIDSINSAIKLSLGENSSGTLPASPVLAPIQ